MPVKQLAKRCWDLGTPNPDHGSDPHFASEAQAREYATDNEPEALATVKVLDAPCWIAVCDGASGTCGEEFADEDEGGNHGGSRAETEQWITSWGWMVTRDGRVFGYCCEDERPSADLAVVEQVPGQMALTEVTP
jgi:hypothetical protein